MADTRTPAERAYDAQRDGSTYTKPIVNQDDDPTENTDAIIAVLRQLDSGGECYRT